jgi:hypothetical protein
MGKQLGRVALVILISGLVLGCSAKETGTLSFIANGEDFVRQGFQSKDGWDITFDHVYINLAEISGYQSDPAYDPHAGATVTADKQADLAGVHLVDLALGGEDASPISVGEVDQAPAGHYNAISWKMLRAEDGAAAGYALVVVGQATKDGQTVDFTIEVESEYEYTCGEYVGDERKGVLQADGTADLEMTFHFDHIFGDAETPLDDELNVGAPGFDPFADTVGGAGTLRMDMAGFGSTMAPDAYQMLVDILPTLGHVGEGHCHCESL